MLDVRANIGDHTFYCVQSAGAEGKVYAFEPHYEAYACSIMNCGSSPHFYEAGRSDQEGLMSIIKHGNSGKNYLVHGDENNIPNIKIDSLNPSRYDLIKIDVECAEAAVLRGAEKIINEHQQKIVIELIEIQLAQFGSSKKDILGWLRERGYSKSSPCDPLKRVRMIASMLSALQI